MGRFDIVSMFLHSMWSAPLMAIIVGYLLWIEAKWAGMIGILVVFVVVPLQCKLAHGLSVKIYVKIRF